jgi:energy-coupling factor transport system permease protein
LLKPLKVIGFPVHYLSIIISLVLRSFPMIFQEADIIIKAQASRGIDFYRGGFRDKIKSFLSLFIPLFVLSFQKAENLANAMDARYFNISKPRTRYHVFKLRQTDFVFLGVTILLIASLFLIKCNSFSFPTFGD